MYEFAHGIHLVGCLTEALKLDRPVRRILLDCSVDRAVSVTVEFVMQHEHAAGIIEAIESYRLEKKNDEKVKT